ncbi:CRISPR-associated endonuclease Cas1 [bioreactor metagenome]|uniref:CRISPR-associated endonuclease Cas1 n=1 Tax=bioreactor metagenome TaxID=1076179 RepID=A0A645AXN6_9ZZZZ
MTWRIVVVSGIAKLDLRLNYLVIRGRDLRKIHLSEISLLVIENTAVSLTAALLCELNKRKIKVVFCDERRNPYGELMPYYGSHDSTEKLRVQIKWKADNKQSVWREIVRGKIINQRNVLSKYEREQYSMLDEYAAKVELNDSTNREGHAAKVYFNALFGKDFTRHNNDPINSCLNYGYSVILSVVNRDIVSAGYFTQLGIFHDNTYNQYNLGSDLMEPFRPFVDDLVVEMGPEDITSAEKRRLIDLLNKEVTIDGKKNYLTNAIGIYCRSVLDSVCSGDLSVIKMCEYES